MLCKRGERETNDTTYNFRKNTIALAKRCFSRAGSAQIRSDQIRSDDGIIIICMYLICERPREGGGADQIARYRYRYKDYDD